MLRRALFVASLCCTLLFAQLAALAHDIGHFDKHAKPASECSQHYLASQVGGGPLASAPTVVLDLESAPAESSIRQRDASIPARFAYRSQAPPASLR